MHNNYCLGEKPLVLHHIGMQLLDHNTCTVNGYYTYNDTMICMGHLNGQVASCNVSEGKYNNLPLLSKITFKIG